MNITSVTASSNVNNTLLGDNNAIKLLEKQKMLLQEQIERTNESKMDEKTKRDLVGQLQSQIQQIDMEILQRRAEKLNQNQNTGTKASDSQLTGSEGGYGNNTSGLFDLVQAGTTYSQARLMNSTKNKLSGRARILEKEIAADEARSLSGANANVKRKELAEIRSKEQALAGKVAETNQTAQNQTNEASRSASGNDNKGNSADDCKDEGKKQAYQGIDIKI